MDNTTLESQHQAATGPAAVAAASRARGLGRPTTLKGWLLLGSSIALAPCHLPLTLGVLATILGGTALGAFLTENLLVVGAIIAAYSVVALVLGYRFLSRAYGWSLFGPPRPSDGR